MEITTTDPEEFREKFILESVGYNEAKLEYDKAQLADDEKCREEIPARTRDLQKALSAAVGFVINDSELLSEKLDK